MSAPTVLLRVTEDGRPVVYRTEIPDGVSREQMWPVSADPSLEDTWHCAAQHPQYYFGCALGSGHTVPLHWDPVAGHAWVDDGRTTADETVGGAA